MQFRSIKQILSTIAVASIASAAFAQSQVPVAPGYLETISVTGTGRSNVAPDRFSFTAGVQTVATTVDEAVNENNRRVANVIAALKKAGATDKEIRTSNFSIYPQQDYSQGQLPKILGYQVSNNITVTRTQIGEAGKLLQTAVSAGVNTSSGLNFEVSDPAKGRDTGLRAAYDDARAKAALLAAAAGRTLGRAMTISEGAQNNVMPPPYPMRAMAMEAKAVAQDVPVEAGTQEMTYTVSVVFELR
ncbi:MAG TPA: SIMPL domain-containing protein [Thermoanaerobaculia bacterium]|nr:SIMPL domain-containing protein [Thermoanaerobaculia bacterium]